MKRVLIAEDDPAMGVLLRREIRDLGYDVELKRDGRAAQRALLESPPDILMTDLRMPGIHGLELMRTIVITAHSSLSSAIEALQCGACDYLVKPLESLTRIAESLSRAEQRAREVAVPAASDDAGARRARLAALVEYLPLAVIVVDLKLQVEAVNRLGAAILAQASTFSRDSDGKLRSPGGERSIAQAVRDAAAMSDGALVVFTVGANDDLAPVSGVALRLPIETGESWIALVLPAGATARSRLESLLVDLYGLTPAESKLASLLAEGLSLEAAGQALGISHNTARTHLSRVFDKTGTSRQAELVARILCGPAMLGLSP